jgi:hypothetical protein
MNKILSSGLVIGAMMSLVGCGGGSSSDAGTASTGGTGSVATGTAFYIDSAVSGINYKCGSTEGITDASGAFTFEVGASCTFYLGDMMLRGVDAGLLVDGENVYETDVKIARILQSLDSDGDPSNGITIKSDTVKALSEHGITSLPTSEAEMDAMLQVIEDNGGTYVSEKSAQDHLYVNELRRSLAGKTFYVVGQEVSDATDIWGGKATFNADLTEMTYVEAYGSDAGETEIAPIIIDGNRLVFGNDTDGSYTVIGENKGDYIDVTDYYSNGTEESHTRFYFDKSKADAYFTTLSSGSSEFRFTTDYLNGKSLYYVQYDDFGYGVMKWNMARMEFTENTFTWTEYDTVDMGTHTISYTIDSEGNIIFNYADGHEHVLSSSEMTNDHIKVCLDGDCNTYLFFDEGKARDFRDSKN